MLGIIKAELRRTFCNRSNLIFVGVTILFCVVLLSFTFISVFDSDHSKALKSYQTTFAFPNSIYSVVSMSYSIFFFLTPAVTSQLIGSDYHLDTWKMILPRTSQRGYLLLSKLINLAVYLVFLLLIAAIIYHLCSIFGAIWLQTSPFSTSSFQGDESLSKGFENILATFSFVVWYVSVGVLLTVFSRSIMIGTFGCFVVFAIYNLIGAYSPDYISIWLAPSHFRNLIPHSETVVPVYDSSHPNCSSLISWAIVTAHILGALLLSYFILKRQDFASK